MYLFLIQALQSCSVYLRLFFVVLLMTMTSSLSESSFSGFKLGEKDSLSLSLKSITSLKLISFVSLEV